MPVFRLSQRILFPPAELSEPDGLLAVGGDLSRKRLLEAYRQGIFPWYSDDSPILWWSPDPRLLLFLDELHISRSLRRVLNRGDFRATADRDFEGVIACCAGVRRKGSPGTWITDEMMEAYCGLHEEGHAHSVEVWKGDRLVGGIYGVSLGRAFFGESMFSLVSNASKVALVRLAELLRDKGFDWIDCQVSSDHLLRMGARQVARAEFLDLLSEALAFGNPVGRWAIE